VQTVTNSFTPPEEIRRRAIERYSLDAIAPQFERWFEQLLGLWGEGFYA